MLSMPLLENSNEVRNGQQHAGLPGGGGRMARDLPVSMGGLKNGQRYTGLHGGLKNGQKYNGLHRGLKDGMRYAGILGVLKKRLEIYRSPRGEAEEWPEIYRSPRGA